MGLINSGVGGEGVLRMWLGIFWVFIHNRIRCIGPVIF